MIVTFDIDAFRSRYPHLADISDATLESCFEEVCAIWGNTDELSKFEYDPEHGNLAVMGKERPDRKNSQCFARICQHIL